MAEIQKPKVENLEGKTPEIVVDQATTEVVSTAEIKEAVSADASSERVKKPKEWLKKGGLAAVGGIAIIGKMFVGLLKFAKEAIMRKGEVGFGKGYEIGTDIFERKKDKS